MEKSLQPSQGSAGVTLEEILPPVASLRLGKDVSHVYRTRWPCGLCIITATFWWQEDMGCGAVIGLDAVKEIHPISN